MDVETTVLPSQPAEKLPVNEVVLFNCNMCGQQFQSPRALPCLHTYCKTCLSSYIQTKLTEIDKGSFPCPDCKEDTQPIDPTRPSAEWADGFPENFFLTDMMDMEDIKNDTVDEVGINNGTRSVYSSKFTLRKSRMSFSESDLRNGSNTTAEDIKEKIIFVKKKEVEETVETADNDTSSLSPDPTTTTVTTTEQQSPVKSPEIDSKQEEEEEPIFADVLDGENGLLLPLEYKFTANVPGVESTSTLDSALLLPTGFVLGVDSRNRHIKKFTVSGKLVGLLRLVSEPGDIVYLPEGEALVTLPQKSQMISIDTEHPLEITHRMKTLRRYLRLAVGQNERLVAANCLGSVWYVDVLSYTGKVLYSIQRLCMGRPSGLTVSPCSDIIVSDSIERSLIAFHWNGSAKFIYKPCASDSDESLEEPKGVCCGPDGHIYLADTKNNRIIRLTSDGQAERILLDSTDGISRPTCIYISNESYMLVSQEDGVVKIYRI